MEAPLHQLPIPPPLSQDALLLQQAEAARALMMAATASAAAGNKAPPSLAAAAAAPGPGPGREQCPRCASRDTKFCYYNNYNTAQPRHFCRACRRYWTLGGSLRNVPVGGSTRKRPRPVRPARRPTRAIAAGMTATPATLLQGAAGGCGLLLSSLLLGSASPLLEGRLGFDVALGDGTAPGAAGGGAAAGDLVHHHQTLQLDAAGQLLPWPAATILESDRAEMTTWRDDAISVFPFPPTTAALWQELAAAAAPVVEGGGELRHGAPPLLL